jgi:hypothetical protein
MKTTDTITVPERVDYLIRKYGGVSEAAEKLNLSRGHLSRLREGHRPAGRKTLEKLGLKRIVTNTYYVEEKCGG